MSIRGRARQEYIDNWLSGKEDPNVEVKPTRVDGKYIVRYKNLPSSSNVSAEVEDVIENNNEPEIKESNKEPVKESIEEPIKESVEEQVKEQVEKEQNNNSEIMNEILKQLKIINDERQAKQLKKQKKKELQQAIRKEFVRHRVIVEDPDPQPEPEPQTVYIDRTPIRVRRRLNLLNKH